MTECRRHSDHDLLVGDDLPLGVGEGGAPGSGGPGVGALLIP